NQRPHMQLTQIPSQIITANQQVAGAMSTAHGLAAQVKTKVADGKMNGRVASMLAEALDAATQARDGVNALGSKNLLNDTFQRYTNHSVRHLTDAVKWLGDGSNISKDRLSILTKSLFDAEVSTRLGSDAATRSLENPSPKALLNGSRSSDSSDSSGPSRNNSYVDGVWLDELGNPARGGDTWAGPDGERFDWDGSPVRDDGNYGGGNHFDSGGGGGNHFDGGGSGYYGI
ncbi:MAG: hypothetical protein ABI200_06090, partial [Gaiellales bacterium]